MPKPGCITLPPLPSWATWDATPPPADSGKTLEWQNMGSPRCPQIEGIYYGGGIVGMNLGAGSLVFVR